MNYLSILCLALLAVNCQPTNKEKEQLTTFVLVRHAEKQILENEPNPALTEKGVRRANMIAEVLGNVSLDAFYSSSYIRTQETIIPLAEKQGKDIKSYDTGDLQGFAEMLLSTHRGQTVIISGHSNTTPNLINLLTKSNDHVEMDESEYDWLFIVDITSGGAHRTKKLKITVE